MSKKTVDQAVPSDQPAGQATPAIGDESLDRRGFLGKAAVGAAGVAGAGLVTACGAETGDAIEGAPAVQTQQRVMWRLASSFPRGLDAIYGSAEMLGETHIRL